MNVALRLQRLDVGAELISRVGDDEPGRELLDYLASAGLDTRRIQIDARYPTGHVIADVSDPQDVRFDIVEPVAWDFIDVVDGTSGYESDVIVFGSLALRNAISRSSLLRILDAAQLKVFDVNLRPPFVDRGTIEQLLSRADWAKLNDKELEVICGWHGAPGGVEQSVHELASRYGLDTVCITLGHRGAVALSGDRLFRHPGFDVDVIDTIGCGDSFLACWLAQTLAGEDPERALAYACAMGALVAASPGSNPRIDEQRVLAMISA